MICIMTFMNGNYREVLEVEAPAMHTTEEVWLLDLTDFFKVRKDLCNMSNLVVPVNSNDCRLK